MVFETSRVPQAGNPCFKILPTKYKKRNNVKRIKLWCELHEQVGIVGNDDDRVLLDEVDELLDLVHLRLESFSPILLGKRVGQEGQTLVLVVKVRPVGAKTLKKVFQNVKWNVYIINV